MTEPVPVVVAKSSRMPLRLIAGLAAVVIGLCIALGLVIDKQRQGAQGLRLLACQVELLGGQRLEGAPACPPKVKASLAPRVSPRPVQPNPAATAATRPATAAPGRGATGVTPTPAPPRTAAPRPNSPSPRPPASRPPSPAPSPSCIRVQPLPVAVCS